MNLTTKCAKNLINKDVKISKQAATEILNNCNVESFGELIQNSDFIFDFIKQKCSNFLLEAINKNNFSNIANFAKFYDPILTEFISQAWIKNANEDLTDELLELLENGTEEQKIHCVKYFQKINDPLALDLINKYAQENSETLGQLCTKALFYYQDTELKNKYLEKLQNNLDDFEKYEALNFLINYGDKKDIEIITKNIQTNSFGADLALNAIYNFKIEDLKNFLPILLDEIIVAMPEQMGINTLWNINFVEILEKHLNISDSHTQRILADLKNILNYTLDDNTYTFDLNKDELNEIKNISSKLNNLVFDFEKIKQELQENKTRKIRTLNTLATCKIDCKEEVTNLVNLTNDTEIMCECAKCAKECGFVDLLNKELADKIENENAKALFLSYFN